MAEIQRRDAERARHEARSFEQAETIAETLSKTVLRFEVKAGTQGVLFGSITPTDIADELWRVRKVRVDRRKIDLAEPIKRVGRYETRSTSSRTSGWPSRRWSSGGWRAPDRTIEEAPVEVPAAAGDAAETLESEPSS